MLPNTQISVPELNLLIGTTQAPTVVDVCIDDDFNKDPYLIPGSFRYPYQNVENLVPDLQDKSIVVVCRKGLKLSQGAASLLRAHGFDARYLTGGQVAWRESGQCRLPRARLPKKIRAALWVTKVKPDIDALACAWLIRRFIDPGALFLFVEESAVHAVVEKFDAVPFAIERASHQDQTSFDSFEHMINELGLTSKPFQVIAQNMSSLSAKMRLKENQLAGISEMISGLSHLHRDDLTQVNAALPLFDALFCWAHSLNVVEGNERQFRSSGAAK